MKDSEAAPLPTSTFYKKSKEFVNYLFLSSLYLFRMKRKREGRKHIFLIKRRSGGGLVRWGVEGVQSNYFGIIS
jgi:hypothetical protein